jgi:hypothetical protein
MQDFFAQLTICLHLGLFFPLVMLFSPFFRLKNTQKKEKAANGSGFYSAELPSFRAVKKRTPGISRACGKNM